MRWSIFHFRSNRSSYTWQLIWVFAGEALCGMRDESAAKAQSLVVRSQSSNTKLKRSLASDELFQLSRLEKQTCRRLLSEICGRKCLRFDSVESCSCIAQLGPITFVLRLGPFTVALSITARIRSFAFPVTVGSVVVIIANPAAPPQSIQNQTSRANS